jgi:hypothetical protein
MQEDEPANNEEEDTGESEEKDEQEYIEVEIDEENDPNEIPEGEGDFYDEDTIM